MLIPHEDGTWSWDNGPKCATKDDALKSAQIPVADEQTTIHVVDEMREPMETDE